MSTTAPKRPYDATRRRERAEVDREETRRRIIESARLLFIEQGYVETTVDAIAKRAGVVKQTVYLAAGSKAQLLRAVEKLAAEVEPPPPHDDPAEQVRAIATYLRTVVEATSPVWKAVREAAAVDPEVAAYRQRADQIRHAEYFGLARMVGRPDAADTLAALGSAEMAELLVARRGWTFDRYEAWLADALVRLLLD
jgi:AcrR family transcriptional regulator